MKLMELEKVALGIDFDALARYVSELLALEEGAGGCGDYGDAFVEKADQVYAEHFGSKPFSDVYQEVLRIAGEWDVTEVRPRDDFIRVLVQIPNPKITAGKES